ncbi:unnamed protein product [Microthlaspi erraticum]|uniref:non-specific serine/threonine protein kinase n=1 Tax=Microthlaspi erraticum TaxID=1685480 RepID=A0A6D2HCZ6_9BRAS|nr:unnamed protein product [Microthlaspi erraticum]
MILGASTISELGLACGIDSEEFVFMSTKMDKRKRRNNDSKWCFFNKLDMILGASTISELGLACGIDSEEFVFMSTKSKWCFFNKLDMILGASTISELGLACGIDSEEFVFMSTKSKWCFFNKLDMILGASTISELGLACGIDSEEFVFMSTKMDKRKRRNNDGIQKKEDKLEDDVSIPADLEAPILERLPLYSLVQLQLALKNWSSLFTENLRLSPKWFVHVAHLSQIWLLDSIDRPRHVKVHDFGSEVITSMVQCDGNFLCSTMSVSRGKTIRKLVFCDMHEVHWIYKEDLSRYDHYLIGHEKILRFNSGCFDSVCDHYGPEAEIYEFSKKRWRSMDFKSVGIIDLPMKVVSVEGNSFFLVSQQGKMCVQSFDFSREAFRKISVPHVEGGMLALSPHEDDGLLLLCQQPGQSQLWVAKQVNKEVAAWEKLFQVKTADQFCGQSFIFKEEKIIAFFEQFLEDGTGTHVGMLHIGQSEIGMMFQTTQAGRHNTVSINSVYAPSLRTEKKVKSEPSPRIFSLKELQVVTKRFDNKYKIGEGPFSSVYRGQLSDGSQIAVKRLKAWSSREEIVFAVEVEILARIRHKNLLSVRGYCEEGQERLIVYDYMPKLSLVSRLHGRSHLYWTSRMNIAVTTAQAIAYLHHHATPKIVHGDVRTSNVLLDSEFEARVMDFGYGKLMPDDAGDGAAKTAKGNKSNLGYLSPECAESGKESEMGDVYSYGVVLLELVTGKRPVEKVNQTTKLGLTEWVLHLVYERKFGEIVDQKLNGWYVEEELKRVVLVGLLCAQSEPERRPTMSEVVEMLMNESKEKMAYIEANPLFNRISDGGEVADESSEIIPHKQEQE